METVIWEIQKLGPDLLLFTLQALQGSAFPKNHWVPAVLSPHTLLEVLFDCND